MKIVVVDDHPLIREGLVHVLRELDPGAVVLEADSADGTIALLADHADVRLMLLDLTLPGAEGLSLLDEVRRSRDDIPVVVLSAHDQRDAVQDALNRGAMGFISKRSPTPVLVRALELVLAGGVYVPPQALAHAAGAYHATDRAPAHSSPPPLRPQDIGLTDRQADVLALLVRGKQNKVICRDLGLAEGTVKTHISAIFRALDVSNRTEALFAISKLGIQFPPVVPKPEGVGAPAG